MPGIYRGGHGGAPTDMGLTAAFAPLETDLLSADLVQAVFNAIFHFFQISEFSATSAAKNAIHFQCGRVIFLKYEHLSIRVTQYSKSKRAAVSGRGFEI